MLTPEQIPDAVVEALLAHLNTCECRNCTAETIVAMLNAWPGANRYSGYLLDQPYDHIILPLPQQEGDK